MAILEARDITKKYKSFSLDIPHFVLPDGSTTVLLGPSGSGKSTLLEVMGYLEKPDSGEILLDGKPLNAKSARSHITAVFQRPYLIRGTVERNVSYGLRLRHVDAKTRETRVRAMLDLVGLSGFDTRSVAELSGGEAQRVALARALVLEPSVLLLDEPLASLDEELKEQLSLEFAHILKEKGITALYVTHDRFEALTVADYIATIRNGTLVSNIKKEDMLSSGIEALQQRFARIAPEKSIFEGQM